MNHSEDRDCINASDIMEEETAVSGDEQYKEDDPTEKDLTFINAPDIMVKEEETDVSGDEQYKEDIPTGKHRNFLNAPDIMKEEETDVSGDEQYKEDVPTDNHPARTCLVSTQSSWLKRIHRHPPPCVRFSTGNKLESRMAPKKLGKEKHTLPAEKKQTSKKRQDSTTPPPPEQEPEEMAQVPYVSAPQSSQHRPPKEPQPRPKRVISVPRGRGRGRGRGRAQYGGAQSKEEDELQIIIDDELLIAMVEARPPLWDSTHTHHAKRTISAALWEEIYSEVCTCWEDLSSQEKWFVGNRIKTRWFSIRDRHIRDLREEGELPSGSAPSTKSTYQNRHLLGFLQKSDQLRDTHSSTGRTRRRTERAAPEPSSPPSPSNLSDPTPVPPPADQGQPPSPLPASSSAGPIRQSIEISFGELVRPLRTGRRQDEVMLDLIKLTKESLMRLDDKMKRVREEFDRLRLARAEASTGPPSASLLYLQSMAPLLETLPFEKQMIFRKETCDLLGRLCCPPPTPTPQTPPPRPTPSPQSHSPSFSIASTTPFHQYRSPSRTHSRHHSPSRTHSRQRSPSRTHSRHRSRSPSRYYSRSPAHHYTHSPSYSRHSHHHPPSPYLQSLPHSLGHSQHLGYFPPTQSTPMAQMLSQGDSFSHSTPSQNFPLP